MAYSKNFYSTRHDSTMKSATRILGFIQSFYQFHSVADFGCGIGTWLYASKKLGASSVMGFDGPWVPHEFLTIDKDEFSEVNFEKFSLPEKQFDLAISLEVAEHLSEEVSTSFVSNLCSAAPVVLFGAAIPGQGGNGHINEQWISYWSDKFAHNGYEILDVIRPEVWECNDIPFWYKQNPVVFYNQKVVNLGKECKLPSFYGSEIVHPEMFRIRAVPSLIERVKLILNVPRYIVNRLRDKELI